jgi:hypothetical protein
MGTRLESVDLDERSAKYAIPEYELRRTARLAHTALNARRPTASHLRDGYPITIKRYPHYML